MGFNIDDWVLKSVNDQHYLLDFKSASISSINASTQVILSLLKAGFSRSEVARHISQHTGTPSEVIEQQLDGLAKDLNSRKESIAEPTTAPFDKPMPALPAHQQRYQIGDKVIAVYFSNAPLMAENHSLLSTMKTGKTTADHSICIFEEEQDVYFYIDGKPWKTTTELSWINGLLRHCLVQLAYQRDTLLTLHASAFANDHDCIVVIAPSGTGKSTLAAQMCIHGYRYLGDDTIPIDMATNSVLPIPTAISLKPGSWNLLPSIAESLAQTHTQQIAEKVFKPWVPPTSTIESRPTKIAHIVFYDRDESDHQGLTSISVEEALSRLQQAETRFDPEQIAATLSKLIDWTHSNSISSLHCASLLDSANILADLFTNKS